MESKKDTKKKNSFKLMNFIKKEIKELTILFRCLPSLIVTLFVTSVICMNLLANKTIVQNYYIALDGGILISWLSFMCMDIITKHFGPKVANKLAIMAILVNLFACLIFYIVSLIPSYANDYIAFNSIFGGTWFVLFGSTIAFLFSSLINNFLNWLIGKSFQKNSDSKIAFVTRTYISTFVAQFIDNLIFSVIVFMFFAPIFWNGFCWTFLQCLFCALTGAFVELFMEILFSWVAYKVIKKWKEDEVGKDYFNYIKGDN